MRAPLLAVVAVAAVVLGADGSAAQALEPTVPPSAKLAYTRDAGAESCPDEKGLRDSIAARLGYDPFHDDAPQTVVVRVGERGGALRAAVQLRDAAGKTRGERALVSAAKDCAELASSMALAISIAIDPLDVGRSAALAPAPPAPPPPPPPAPLPAPLPPPPAPPPATRPVVAPARSPPAQPIVIRAAAGAALSFGVAPSTAVGFTAEGGARYRFFSIGIQGRADLPASRAAPVGSVKSSLILATLLPCLHGGIAFGCAEVSLGALDGEGSGVANPEHATTIYANAGARVGLEVPVVKPISARLTAEGAATLTRTTLHLNGAPAWATPAICGSIGASALAAF